MIDLIAKTKYQIKYTSDFKKSYKKSKSKVKILKNLNM